jgi:hypothetical protein
MQLVLLWIRMCGLTNPMSLTEVFQQSTVALGFFYGREIFRVLLL